VLEVKVVNRDATLGPREAERQRMFGKWLQLPDSNRRRSLGSGPPPSRRFLKAVRARSIGLDPSEDQLGGGPAVMAAKLMSGRERTGSWPAKGFFSHVGPSTPPWRFAPEHIGVDRFTRSPPFP